MEPTAWSFLTVNMGTVRHGLANTACDGWNSNAWSSCRVCWRRRRAGQPGNTPEAVVIRYYHAADKPTRGSCFLTCHFACAYRIDVRSETPVDTER
ncbi:MAG: hypothetical protein J07HX5_01873, partial [halophilic archaeon J07HX5]